MAVTSPSVLPQLCSTTMNWSSCTASTIVLMYSEEKVWQKAGRDEPGGGFRDDEPVDARLLEGQRVRGQERACTSPAGRGPRRGRAAG